METKVEGVVCPCCGAPVNAGVLPIEALLALPIGGLQGDILDKLVTDYPRWSRRDAIMEFAYADYIDGGPESRGAFYVSLNRLRRQLKPLGWFVDCDRSGVGAGHIGEGSNYRLRPLVDNK